MKKIIEYSENDFDYYSIHESNKINIGINLKNIVDRYKVFEKILLDKFISNNLVLKIFYSIKNSLTLL